MNFRNPEELTDPYKQLGLVYLVINANAVEASSVDFKIMTGGEGRSFSQTTAPKGMTLRERKAFSFLQSSRDMQDPKLKLRKRAKAAQDVRELESGPAYELFRRPARGISTTDLFNATFTHLLTLGESLWIKIGPDGKPTSEWPTELLPVKPTLLRKLFTEDGGRIAGWEYTTRRNQQKQVFDASEVVYFRFPDPDNVLVGMSPLLAGEVDYQTDFQAAGFNLAFFLNSANPGGILRMKGEGETSGIEERDRLENILNDKHSGYGKRGRWMILDGEAEVDMNTVTQRDMEFLGVRKFTLEMLLGTFRTPKTVIGLDNDVPRDVAQTQIKRWWCSTIFSLHHLVEDALAIQLFIPLTSEAEVGVFDHSNVDALQENLTEKIEQLQKMQQAGITLRIANKKLELLDEDELGAAADIAFIGASLQPLDGMMSDAMEPDDAAEPPAAESKPQEEPEEETPKSVTTTGSTKALGTDEQRALFWEAKQRTILRPAESMFRAKIKSVLYRMRVETLKRLETVAGPSSSKMKKDLLGPEQVERVLVDRAKWAAEMYESLHPAYVAAMKKGGASAAREADYAWTFSETDPAVIAILETRRLQLSAVTQGMIDSVKRHLIESAHKGETTDQTARMLRDLFNEMSIGRTTRIARTESAIAVEGAREIVFEDAGIDKIMWITARDQFVRDSHKIDGQVRKRGDDFPNGLRWPLDLEANAGAEEYVNCRCLAVPAD